MYIVISQVSSQLLKRLVLYINIHKEKQRQVSTHSNSITGIFNRLCECCSNLLQRSFVSTDYL